MCRSFPIRDFRQQVWIHSCCSELFSMCYNMQYGNSLLHAGGSVSGVVCKCSAKNEMLANRHLPPPTQVVSIEAHTLLQSFAARFPTQEGRAKHRNVVTSTSTTAFAFIFALCLSGLCHRRRTFSVLRSRKCIIHVKIPRLRSPHFSPRG